MKVKTQVKAGGRVLNHNQTLVRDRAQAPVWTRSQAPHPSLKVKTQVKAGGLFYNHNQTLVRALAR